MKVGNFSVWTKIFNNDLISKIIFKQFLALITASGLDMTLCGSYVFYELFPDDIIMFAM